MNSIGPELTAEVLRLLGRDHDSREIEEMTGVKRATVNAIGRRNGTPSKGKAGRKKQRALWGPQEPTVPVKARAA